MIRLAFSMGVLAMVTAVLVATAGNSERGEQTPDSAATPPPGSTQNRAIRIATSEDGSRFTDSGGVLIAGAARPHVVRLLDGDLLAVFEAPGQTGGGLAATKSKDGGKTWLPARPVRVNGLPAEAKVGRPNLVAMPSGLVRLYFVSHRKDARHLVAPPGMRPGQPRQQPALSGVEIRSAVTRDGVEYQVDPRTAIPCPNMEPHAVQLVAFWTDKQMVILVARAAGDSSGRADDERRGRAGDAQTSIHQFVSPDGREFSPADRARFAGQIGHVLRLDRHHWRMYITHKGEIRSRMSNDGFRWREEPDVCLRGGFDPVVAPTQDKKFIMLFSSPMDGKASNTVQLAAASPERTKSTDQAGTGASPQDSTKSVSARDSSTPSSPGDTAASPADTTSDALKGSGADWEAFATEGYESELGADWRQGMAGRTDSAGDSGGSGLAPLPDFRNKIDYIGWYARNCIVPDDQNAFYSYAPLQDALGTRGDDFKDMFNDPGAHGPPGPWNPNEHPDWETSYLQTQDILAQYFDAARDASAYTTPLLFSGDTAPEDRLLIGCILPNLRSLRTLARATLGQAWRAPYGTVAPDQMRSALESVLGTAAHLQDSTTLIERLVSAGIRNLGDENARWALQRGVFNSAEQIEATLNILREKDVPASDPGQWVVMEHAATMDVMQYLFEPSVPGGEPQVRPDRVELFMKICEEPVDDEDRHGFSQLTTTDADAAVQAVTVWYEQMLDHCRTRFPYADGDQFDLRAQELNREHPIIGVMLPSLSRANELLRRAEASRRATQLTYSLELFRVRNGRYPASIDELPYEQVYDVRTDPYSGTDFAYRLTDAGVMIYSVGSNGVDEGGVHSKRWGDGEAGDYVFWPPQE